MDPEAVAREERPGGPISVVHVEDDTRTAHLLAKYLESQGIVVTHAANGADGVAALFESHAA
jgi:DNA-binding response OmpR family regulator